MSTWLSADIRRLLYVLSLVAVVIGSTAAAVTLEPSNWQKVVLQGVAVVAAAALGNALKADQSRSLVRQQAGSSIRRLIEQATRMGDQVSVLERQRDVLKDHGHELNSVRVGDWFDSAASALRVEINATASAIEDWGAMAPDIQNVEVQNFLTRNKRLALGAQQDTQESE
jgi:hypothetical protein